MVKIMPSFQFAMNATRNVSFFRCIKSSPEREILVSIFLCLSFIGTFINVIIVVIYVRYTSVRQMSSIYIVSLAVSDGLFALTMSVNATRCFWMNTAMKFNIIYSFFIYTLPFNIEIIAIIHVLIIGLDRAVAVARPFTYPQIFTARSIKLSIAFIWVLLFIMLSIHIIFRMNPKLFHLKGLLVTVGVLRIILMFLLIVIYLVLLRVGLQAAKRFDKEMNMIEEIARRAAHEESTSSAKGAQAKRQERVLRYVTLLVGMYLLCRLPEAIIVIIKKMVRVPPILNEIMIMITMLNPIINPYLYSLRDPRFQHVLRTWLPKKWKIFSTVAPVDS